MWVVKLGGSFAHDDILIDWLKILARRETPQIVIVPGGGDFAEQVRQAQRRWRFDDHTAHHMAILAMHQMGRMFSSLEPSLESVHGVKGVLQAIGKGRVPVWLPDLAELDHDGVPASWDVTSDSLSAWLARKIRARMLVLVKSVKQPCQAPAELQRAGVVDPEFLTWLPAGIRFHCYHHSQIGLLHQRLFG